MSGTHIYKLSAYRPQGTSSIDHAEVTGALLKALTDLGLDPKPWLPASYAASQDEAPWLALTLNFVSDLLEPRANEKAKLNETILSLNYSAEDIRDLAEEAGIPESAALARVKKWSKQIEETVAALCDEQLANVVESNCP